MIREAKDLLEEIILRTVQGVTVARSALEEKQKIMSRSFPLVALITNPGAFDETGARTLRYVENGRYLEKYVRGYRTLPILIHCWEEGEEKADALVSCILPEIPSRWEHDGFVCSVEIGREEHSDHAGNVSALYVSVIEVTFTAAAARKSEELSVIESAEPEGGEYDSKI